MAQSRYNLKNAYYDIYTINRYFFENYNGRLVVQTRYGSIHDYCHYGNTTEKGNCRDYFEMASSGVIHLLKKLKDKYNLEYDKLAEYAILWLSYKLNIFQKTRGTKLNDFYTKYIETNNDYNNKIKDNDLTYKEIINTKKDLMDMDVKEISKFNIPFYILFYLNYVFHDEYMDCTDNSNLAKRFAKEFEELNKDSKNIEGSSYSKLLSTLSNDYKNLKNIYHNNKCTNFPPPPEFTPKKRSTENSGKDSLDNSGNSVAQSIVVNTVGNPSEKSVVIPIEISEKDSGQNSLEISVKGSEHILGETPEVTSSSSSISTTLIPALSIVSIIPVFFGIAYKTIYKKKIKKSKEEIET
ncbi:CIR protein PIR protein [Plasmodium vinckei lentum]|uniref:CIR protein PIR protein n=1 Tax=Plasmodium vinckei lentum TaxID=138297 RepID=A0A6V7RYV2_PLAVN|nr:CIR protein PIR protein [Plasmodium vinckei lentum]